MYLRSSVCIFLGIFMLASVHAHANDNKGYVGFEAGYAFADLRAEQTNRELVAALGGSVVATYDKADLNGRISLGFNITEMIAVEAGYFTTADLNANYVGVTGAGLSYTASETYSASGLDMFAVFKPSATLEGFFIKFGLHDSEVDGVITASTAFGTASVSGTASDTGLAFGLGYDWDTGNDNFARLSYVLYSEVGGLTDADLGLFNISYNIGF